MVLNISMLIIFRKMKIEKPILIYIGKLIKKAKEKILKNETPYLLFNI